MVFINAHYIHSYSFFLFVCVSLVQSIYVHKWETLHVFILTQEVNSSEMDRANCLQFWV